MDLLASVSPSPVVVCSGQSDLIDYKMNKVLDDHFIKLFCQLGQDVLASFSHSLRGISHEEVMLQRR
jgi:hypothetical protein